MWYILGLQFFAEGGGESGAGDAGQGDAAPAAPDTAGGKKRRENPLAGVKYGIGSDANVITGETDEIGGPGAAGDGKVKEAPTGEDFESLIKGKYKKDFDDRVQGILRERLKGASQREAEYQEREKKLAPALALLAGKYGVRDGDLDGLVAKITSDDSYLADEALEQGLTVEQLRTMRQLETDNRTLRMAQEQRQREVAAEAHVQELIRQAQEAQKLYPDLDLRKELADPNFRRLTGPEVRVDVRTAYEIVHRDELSGRNMAIGTQQAAQKVAASVAANRARPKEGAAAASAPAAKTDPASLTKADREEIRRRVRAGDRTIAF